MPTVSPLISLSRRSPESDIEEQKLRLARALIDSLTDDARATLARELAERLRVGEQTRSPTGVLATVLQLFKGETVTAARLMQEIADRGVQAAPKEIYNSIGYLARTGRLKRVGYGRYLVDGVEIGTSDDLGGEKTRDEDLSDDPRE